MLKKVYGQQYACMPGVWYLMANLNDAFAFEPRWRVAVQPYVVGITRCLEQFVAGGRVVHDPFLLLDIVHIAELMICRQQLKLLVTSL